MFENHPGGFGRISTIELSNMLTKRTDMRLPKPIKVHATASRPIQFAQVLLFVAVVLTIVAGIRANADDDCHVKADESDAHWAALLKMASSFPEHVPNERTDPLDPSEVRTFGDTLHTCSHDPDKMDHMDKIISVITKARDEDKPSSWTRTELGKIDGMNEPNDCIPGAKALGSMGTNLSLIMADGKDAIQHLTQRDCRAHLQSLSEGEGLGRAAIVKLVRDQQRDKCVKYSANERDAVAYLACLAQNMKIDSESTKIAPHIHGSDSTSELRAVSKMVKLSSSLGCDPSAKLTATVSCVHSYFLNNSPLHDFNCSKLTKVTDLTQCLPEGSPRGGTAEAKDRVSQ